MHLFVRKHTRVHACSEMQNVECTEYVVASEIIKSFLVSNVLLVVMTQTWSPNSVAVSINLPSSCHIAQLSVPLSFCQFLSCASCIFFCFSQCCLCSRSITSRPCVLPPVWLPAPPWCVSPVSHCLTSCVLQYSVSPPSVPVCLRLSSVPALFFLELLVYFLVFWLLPAFYDPVSASAWRFLVLLACLDWSPVYQTLFE